MFYRAWGSQTPWFCRTGVPDAQNASLEGIFWPNVLKMRVLRGSILVISTYPLTQGIETPGFTGPGAPNPWFCRTGVSDAPIPSREPRRPLWSHFCLEGEGGALKPPSPSNFPSPLTGATSGTEPPHALSGGLKWLLVCEGGPQDEASKTAIFWVSACSVVRWALLEPGRSVSCKSGLPPAQPAPVGEARQPGKWPPHASSNAVGWPEMAHRGGPQDEASKSRFSGFLRILWCRGHF